MNLKHLRHVKVNCLFQRAVAEYRNELVKSNVTEKGETVVLLPATDERSGRRQFRLA